MEILGKGVLVWAHAEEDGNRYQLVKLEQYRSKWPEDIPYRGDLEKRRGRLIAAEGFNVSNDFDYEEAHILATGVLTFENRGIRIIPRENVKEKTLTVNNVVEPWGKVVTLAFDPFDTVVEKKKDGRT